MTEKEFVKKMGELEKKIEQLRRNQWPRKAGVFAVNLFNENFRKGGFLDKTRTKWARTKRQDAKLATTASRYKPLQSKRQHLVSSNRKETSAGEVRIINDTPYAAVHNEGGRAGRGLKVVIPKRQFVGQFES